QSTRRSFISLRRLWTAVLALARLRAVAALAMARRGGECEPGPALEDLGSGALERATLVRGGDSGIVCAGILLALIVEDSRRLRLSVRAAPREREAANA